MNPTKPKLRIVVADDFVEWRQTVRKILAMHEECEIIAEAESGPEAVEKCAQTQPDIVLLDIGMPGLNGIEAAKLIRQKSPQTTIIFQTQQNDIDIMKAALKAGGSAYILKAKAATELPHAIASLSELHATVASAPRVV